MCYQNCLFNRIPQTLFIMVQLFTSTIHASSLSRSITGSRTTITTAFGSMYNSKLLNKNTMNTNMNLNMKVSTFSRPSGSNLSMMKSQMKGQMFMWGEENSPFDNKNQNQIPKSNSFSSGRDRQPIERTARGGENTQRSSTDSSGRTIRKRGTNNYNDNGGDNDDDWGGIPAPVKSRDSFDDFSVDVNDNNGNYYEPYEYTKPKQKNDRRSGGRGGRGGGRGGRGGGRGRDRAGGRGRGGGRGGGYRREEQQETQGNAEDRKINLRALEGAGFAHLYGLAPVLNALKAQRRDFKNLNSIVDLELLSGEDLEHETNQRERKPEAQFTPWLFVQENMRNGSPGGKTRDKAAAAQEVERVAKEMDVPIAYVDKGVLNTLCGSRPHQGYILRCGTMDFEPMSQIPFPDKDDPSSPSLWLCLDEVVDPQNFGALLRSAYFLGGGSSGKRNIGVMVCSKNSAPPSPVVSAASAGALELCEVYSTSNLPRTLNAAKSDGWRILGAAASVPYGMIDEATGENAKCLDLHEVDVSDSKPTILVLGSEGHGLRTLVARSCNGFIRIPGSHVSDTSTQAGVDSLNVSVTGGIMLWHFISSEA